MTSPQTVEPEGLSTTPRWRVGLKVALALVCGVLVLMWIGIFTGFFDKTAPGTLDDKSFAVAAQPICAATKAKLDQLPKAFETTDHVARAEVVAQTNVDLRDMLEQLKAIAPTADRDGRMTQEWLSDWSTYVGNREDYVVRLKADETARFLESPKSSATEQVSKPIDRFAYVNDMDSCDTPEDMA